MKLRDFSPGFERVMKYTDTSDPNACWVPSRWKRTKSGYVHLRVKGKDVEAHRVVYEHVHGALPSGTIVRHSCDNKECVNPQHLLAGTVADNSRDALIRGQIKTVLTPERVKQIRESTETDQDLATRFGVTRSCVNKVRTGRTWRHV